MLGQFQFDLIPVDYAKARDEKERLLKKDSFLLALFFFKPFGISRITGKCKNALELHHQYNVCRGDASRETVGEAEVAGACVALPRGG
ncbi:hypothetical protein [Victivallis vadensis]|uniref:hypothetical protein n=1 Tax=Victivallis vadensis TaxID=172901 RepID=UPI003AF83CDC